MGWFFTVIYLVAFHLSPGDLFPELAPYHPQLWIGVLALAGTLFSLVWKGYLYRMPQNLLMLGLLAAILLSEVAHGWFGYLSLALSSFGTSVAAFFFCAANARRVGQLRFLMIGLTVAALYLAVRGIIAYHTGYGAEMFLDGFNPALEMEAQTATFRVRGAGLLRDPNDFSQFLLVILCFIWLAWRKGAWLRNTFLVVCPALLLAYAIYRTQSRGALLGLAALVFIGLRSRVGTVKAAAAGVVLLTGVLASGYLAQRQNSLTVHEQRVVIWRNGLAMWKANPVFGVGFEQFAKQNQEEGGLTAHNSFVLCLAELGLVGYGCWLALIATTLVDLNILTKIKARTTELAAAVRWAYALRLALLIFLVTAWFLSRTYIITLYALLGISVALAQVAGKLTNGAYHAAPRRWIPLVGWTVAGSIALIYGTIRLESLL